MKSTSQKEDSDNKKKYVFFSDPDVIVQRAETSAAAAQVRQHSEVQQQQDYGIRRISNGEPSNLPIQFDLRGLENLLLHHPAQPDPFTFISALKRKLALADCPDARKKAYDPYSKQEIESLAILQANSTQNLHDVMQKMDFIGPLKAPDVKITPKTLDFSSRENSMPKELTPKFEVPSKDLIHERTDRSTKTFERVQRKLVFSTSDSSSIINSEIEPLKVPNSSIVSNLSKKKEYIRENSREKENRSKRIKKEDFPSGNPDEAAQDFFKRSKSPRHISRKEGGDSINETVSVAKFKNDRLSFHMPRESDFAAMKQKTKNFATSTAKKDNDKRHKSFNIRSLKSARDNSLESKSRTYSNESLSERSTKVPDKLSTKESFRIALENTEHRYKDDFHLLKQTDDQKYIFPSDNKQLKQHKTSSQFQGKVGHVAFKEQSKRSSEKMKSNASKVEGKSYIPNSKESDDFETITDSNSSLRVRSPCTVASVQQLKSKDPEKIVQNANVIKPGKSIEDSKYTDDSSSQCTSISAKKNDESFTQSITTTKPTNNNETNSLDESTFSEALLDPRRISFRDESHSQQKEFCDLITPDMNLIPRSRRRKQLAQNSDLETDVKSSKHAPTKVETEQEPIPLLHPTALHMQFQAELHLLDSFNESLRQVMDVEKCLYNVNRDSENDMPAQHNQPNNELKSHFSKITDERNASDSEQCSENNKLHKHTNTDKESYVPNSAKVDDFDNNLRKLNKTVKAVEVQTQTVNDIATQTEVRSTRRNVQSRCPESCGITYERGFVGNNEIPQLSLDSAEQFEDLDQIEEISLPSKLRTMSEISLHETTSSIRTETGTEISISTRDVTCSFNKYLDLEIAQLIKDEKQRYDKIEMLFKSREKTLNDRTKKLVKLEEQKRALRDTGQDSRVSSVKKKQRALLLKLQQEKDEMNRLKELHKIASQERKLMLQKQRNMFNPQMSTKNILTKLKRSADSQSPRRLSGPMKGYDIRSNSSMSSLVDSDKSQHDRSQTDTRLQISESDLHFSKLDLPKNDKFAGFIEESNTSLSRFDKSNEIMQGDMSQEKCPYKLQKEGTKSKYEIKSRKFEEKMPRGDILRLKSHQHSVESILIPSHSVSISGQYQFEKEKSPDVSQLLQQNLNRSNSELAQSESDTLVEELSKKSKPSQVYSNNFQSVSSPKERETLSKSTAVNTETILEEISSINQDTVSKTSKSSQVSEDILQTHSRSSKKSNKSISTDKDISKKTQYTSELKSSSKRKSSKCQKSKSSSSILTENVLRSKSNSQMSEELIKHHNKRTKVEKEFTHLNQNDENTVSDNMDFNESHNSLQTFVRHSKSLKDKSSKLLNDIIDDCESKENILCHKIFDRNLAIQENSPHDQERSIQGLDNISAKSQIDAFAVSHHSSGESDRNYTKSVVVRAQDHNLKTSRKLEQILNAREAALASRKNCVEEWMAWHAKLRAEEDRVARMEQAALKLVTATSNVFSQQDTTVSSDTSDIEGRIELLTEKLAERRIEMSRLKREARKQTKQKLRALEANLLNQIKKYDTTIHEMRKKLESKKGKDYDKLAIESKSLADFKVPEIPLKRIQDLYRSSALLRSRSESDLLSTKRQIKDIKTTISTRNESIQGNSDKSVLQRGSKSINISEQQLCSVKMDTINHSIQSIFDECISEQIECNKFGSASISSVSDDNRYDKYTHYGIAKHEDETQSRQTIASDVERTSDSEEVKTEIDSIPKSETNVPTVSESRTMKNYTSVFSELSDSKTNSDNISKQSQRRSTLQSEIEEIEGIGQSRIHSEKSQRRAVNSDVEIKSIEINNEILNPSKKLHFLHLNTKNMDDDISSLENELKVLSERMSRMSRKSNDELHSDEKSTSKDISEMLSKSERTDQSNDMEDVKNGINKKIELDKKDINSDVIHTSLSDAKSKSNDFNDSKRLSEEVDVMSVIMSQDEVSLSRSNREIDYKARSKEILNVVEKSIISEHIKATESDLNRSLHERNNLSLHKKGEDISNDATSLGTDIKSISEVYSKGSQSKEDVSPVHNKFKIIYDVGKNEDIEKVSIHTRDFGNEELLEENDNAALGHISIVEKEKSSNLSTHIEYNLSANNATISKSNSGDSANVILKEISQISVDRVTSPENASAALKTQSFQQISDAVEVSEISKRTESLRKDLNEERRDTSNSSTASPTNKKISIAREYEKLDYINDTESKSHYLSKGAENLDASQKSRKTEDDEESKIALDLIASKSSFDKDDWTISDSFEVQQNIHEAEEEHSEEHLKSSDADNSGTFSDTKDESQEIDNAKVQDFEENIPSDIEDTSLFLPKGESTNIEVCEDKFDETAKDTQTGKSNDELDDILDIIARDNSDKDSQEEKIETSESDDLQKAIHDSVTKILDKVEKSIENNTVKDKVDIYLDAKVTKSGVKIAENEEGKSASSNTSFKHKLEDEGKPEIVENKDTSFSERAASNEVDNEPVIDISLHVKIKDDESLYHMETKSRDITITELEPDSVEGEILPELEIDAKIELAEEEPATSVSSIEYHEDMKDYVESENKDETCIKVMREEIVSQPIIEQDSSDGEQLDNLVEIAISGLDTIEKEIDSSLDHSSKTELKSQDKSDIKITEEIQETEVETEERAISSESVNNLKGTKKPDTNTSDASTNVANKTFDVLKDPEYEDISEESLEVSEIFDKSESRKSSASQKSSGIPEKYEAVQKSEEVLRILDEIAQKSSLDSENASKKLQTNLQVRYAAEEKEKLPKEVSTKEDVSSELDGKLKGLTEDVNREKDREDALDNQTSEAAAFEEDPSLQASTNVTEEKESDDKYKPQQKISEICEQDASSDSSEGRDTPKGVSEIEMDSPRDLNDSKLDIDALNDDLLAETNSGNQNADSKNNFHVTPIVGSSEKDIEVMIDKLKASLEQPGLEVAELEAKLLRIEQLQIELEIKKLEAEEVSYYVREIPNKPPPPYTPPGGGGRISTSLGSPSPPPAVIPSNVEELTAFTEKATSLIFKAKEAGEDIMSLEPPPEIYELTKENDETVKRDRRIYNTFLFDLCKETIAEVYQAEYEKPGPSWTKPNVKTKPTMKIPKTVDELHEYVSKEVATLFGFKTKLQRENMVMRWSRKRRDRVDELLAREAQAEEDEWTKFHHDELAVKNGLTVAILDTLIMETVKEVKVAYAKKRKIMV